MTSEPDATQLLKQYRSQGMTLEQSLDQLKHRKLGLIAIIKALRSVEGLSYAEATDLIERRGDYKSF
jgi:hypothetical protein